MPQKGKLHPEKYLSIIIDGMDQNKTMIPHCAHLAKTSEGMWKLWVHVVGPTACALPFFEDFLQRLHPSNSFTNIAELHASYMRHVQLRTTDDNQCQLSLPPQRFAVQLNKVAGGHDWSTRQYPHRQYGIIVGRDQIYIRKQKLTSCFYNMFKKR